MTVHQFPRPTTAFLEVVKQPVEATCPQCGSQEVARYPVVGEIGWWHVTKCQDCLYSLERVALGPLGSITHLSDDI